MRKSLQWCLFFLIVLREISAQNCELKWENETTISDDGFGIILPEIEDVELPGTILLKLISENVEGITRTITDSTSKKLYMNAEMFNETSIVVKLTEDFFDYEKYEIETRIYITVYFACKDGKQRKLEVRQPIRDTNNHEPEFENTPYVYKLPMPFPGGIRLELLQEISAVDLDISQSEMKFFLDPDDKLTEALEISRSTDDPNNPKRQFASLRTKVVLNLLNDTSFYIYANDSGDPIRTGRAQVTIQVDGDNSALGFEKPFYSANCSGLQPDEADGFILTFTEGDISLSGGTNGITDWTIEDVFKKYTANFAVDDSSNPKKIQIKLVNPPASFFNESFVELILKAKTAGAAASTVIHLTLPGRQSTEDSPLRFAKPFYSANCTSLRPEEADGFILTFTEGDISLGGEKTNDPIEWTIEDISKKYNDNFEPTVPQNSEKVQIKLVNPPASFFNESFVALILSAKKAEAVASTVIHLTLPGRQSTEDSPLRFAKPFYSANCSSLRPEEADGFTLTFTEGDISLGGETDDTIEWLIEDVWKQYDDNFNANVSSNLDKVQIRLVNPPASFFNESFVTLILTAKRASATASTVLHLTLPGGQPSEIPDVVPSVPNEDTSTDSTPVIITLAVLLAIVSAGLVASIVLLKRRGAGAKPTEKINGASQMRGEMREVERMDSDPSHNGLPRRSVAFNDTVEEINVARL